MLIMTQDPHYHGHRERLRARLDKDSTALADYEILELVLGLVIRRADTKPLAKALLAKFGTVRGVCAARPSELKAVKGVGPAMLSHFVLLREFVARYGESRVAERLTFTSPQDVGEMAVARLAGHTQEELWVALVDNRNRLIGWERVTSGTVDSTPMFPREVLGLALEHKATGIILVHNHPGGNQKPSRADVMETRKIVDAARALRIDVLDHLVVTETGYYSFKSGGDLD